MGNWKFQHRCSLFAKRCALLVKLRGVPGEPVTAGHWLVDGVTRRGDSAYNRGGMKNVTQSWLEFRDQQLIRPRAALHAMPSQSRPSLFGSD